MSRAQPNKALQLDGAIACFSSSLILRSLNADRAPQLKASVRLRSSLQMENESKQLNEQAQGLMQEERWVDAIKLIESHPSLFEEHAELSQNLGWAYFKLENWKAAQVHLSRARGLNPKLAAAWWALGAAQMEDGVLDEAESNVKEALRIRDSSNARGTLALILMQRGKLGEAEQIHLRGIELKPESSDRWGVIRVLSR